MDKQNIRLIFEKTGRAVYISHLDLMRTIQRAMIRTELPFWHTEGFNPHIYVNLPLALPLGTGSVAEILDIAVISDVSADSVTQKLNAALPSGIKILRTADPERKIKDVTKAEYIISFSCDNAETALSKLNEMMNADKIEVLKRTKKGETTVDIKSHINIIHAETDNETLTVTLTLSTGVETNIGAGLFADAFAAFSGINFSKISIIRTKLLDINHKEFV